MTLEEQVMAMLDALRPMLQADGGDLEFVKAIAGPVRTR